MNAISSLVPFYKPVGKTPLECVEEYKSKNLIDPTTKVSYAGRLDPMAEGVLLLLVGDANKKRREYEHMSKEYEVTVLVGFATDTGDLMGILANSERRMAKSIRTEVTNILSSFVGLVEQKYPIYSSAKVQGKPLYWWARQGRLNEIEIPTHKVHIESIEVLSSNNSIPKDTSSFPTSIGNSLIDVMDPRIKSEDDEITNEALLQYIVASVGSVKGDFRQDEIIAKWQESLEANENSTNHSIIALRISCGSGTYMRQLVADIGEKLNIPLVAFKIKRMKVGEYNLKDLVKV